MKKVKIDKKDLYEHYIVKKYSQEKIAKIFNCGRTSVQRRLKEYNIEREKKMTLYKNKTWLYEQYIVKGLYQREIGKLSNASHRTIGIWLKKFDIKKEEPKYTNEEWLINQYIVLRKSTVKIGRELGVRDSTIWVWLKKFNIQTRKKEKYGLHRNKKWLYEQYIKKKKSIHIIARACNVSYGTLRYWLNKFNIPLRNKSEANIKYKFTYNYLYEEYIINKKNTIEIGKENNCGSGVILTWLKKYNIPRRLKYEYQYGPDNNQWNPNREQVYAPYTETFYDKEFRSNIKKFQYKRDLLTGKTLRKSANLHHINEDKTDDSHYIKGDNNCNLGFVNNTTHGKFKCKNYITKYYPVLIQNVEDLKRGKIPKTWKRYILITEYF